MWINKLPSPRENIDDDFIIKEFIWKIITAKIFLYVYFEKFYPKFLTCENGTCLFDAQAFHQCIMKIQEKLKWENYKIRYSSFEEKIEIIISILEGKETVLNELKESIQFDLAASLWEDIKPQINFFQDKANLSITKNWIIAYINTQMKNLETTLSVIKVEKTMSEFVRRIQQVIAKKDGIN